MVDKTKSKRLDLFERKLEAYDMYVNLYTYREIGKALGVSYEMARKYIKEISEIMQESNQTIEAERVITSRRLNKALRKAYKDYFDGDNKVLGDIIRTEERRSKLLGLDAPAKQDIDVSGMTVVVRQRDSKL